MGEPFHVPPASMCQRVASGLRIHRREIAARFAVENQIAGGCEDARIIALGRPDLLDLPRLRPGLDVERADEFLARIFGIIDEAESALLRLAIRSAILHRHHVEEIGARTERGRIPVGGAAHGRTCVTLPAWVSLLGVSLGRPLASMPVAQVSFFTIGAAKRNLPSVRSRT